jgi:polyisoprenyl-phosphate glycosyltransferase
MVSVQIVVRLNEFNDRKLVDNNNDFIAAQSDSEVHLLSIVVPVFNNFQSLQAVTSGIMETVSSITDLRCEIIFVDDGSSDRSWSKIQELVEGNRGRIRGIKLSKNFGQLAALIAGLESCQGDAVIMMSADLQDPPSAIAELVSEWRKGYDLVMAVRSERRDGLLARFTSKIALTVMSRSIPSMPDTWFDFCLISKRVLEVVNGMKGRFRFIQGDMIHAGFRHSTVSYIRAVRPFGKSGYSFAGRVKNFMDAILDSSYSLIQFFTRSGLIVAFSGLLYAAWIFIARVFDLISPNGWAPIMIVLLTTSGIIITMLGIIAEYLWRIYDSTREKPVYVVDVIIE